MKQTEREKERRKLNYIILALYRKKKISTKIIKLALIIHKYLSSYTYTHTDSEWEILVHPLCLLCFK